MDRPVDRQTDRYIHTCITYIEHTYIHTCKYIHFIHKFLQIRIANTCSKPKRQQQKDNNNNNKKIRRQKKQTKKKRPDRQMDRWILLHNTRYSQ